MMTLLLNTETRYMDAPFMAFVWLLRRYFNELPFALASSFKNVCAKKFFSPFQQLF